MVSKLYSDYGYRKQVANILNRPVSDEMWGFLYSRDVPKRLATGEMTVHAVAEEIRQIERASGRAGKSSSEAGSRGLAVVDPARQEAMARLFAMDAEQDPDVKAFRKEFLNGELLRADDLSDWISRRAREDGRFTLWLQVPLPEGTHVEVGPTGGLVPKPSLAINGAHPAFGSRAEYLEYSDNGNWATIPVRMNGCLGRLRVLSESLSEQFRWQQAQATLFVLTGKKPIVDLIEVRRHLNPRRPALNRITITVDPMIAPREVMRVYAVARQANAWPPRSAPF